VTCNAIGIRSATPAALMRARASGAGCNCRSTGAPARISNRSPNDSGCSNDPPITCPTGSRTGSIGRVSLTSSRAPAATPSASTGPFEHSPDAVLNSIDCTAARRYVRRLPQETSSTASASTRPTVPVSRAPRASKRESAAAPRPSTAAAHNTMSAPRRTRAPYKDRRKSTMACLSSVDSRLNRSTTALASDGG